MQIDWKSDSKDSLRMKNINYINHNFITIYDNQI